MNPVTDQAPQPYDAPDPASRHLAPAADGSGTAPGAASTGVPHGQAAS